MLLASITTLTRVSYTSPHSIELNTLLQSNTCTLYPVLTTVTQPTCFLPILSTCCRQTRLPALPTCLSLAKRTLGRLAPWGHLPTLLAWGVPAISPHRQGCRQRNPSIPALRATPSTSCLRSADVSKWLTSSLHHRPPTCHVPWAVSQQRHRCNAGVDDRSDALPGQHCSQRDVSRH